MPDTVSDDMVERLARDALSDALLARGFATMARGVSNGSVDWMVLAIIDAMMEFRRAALSEPTEVAK